MKLPNRKSTRGIRPIKRIKKIGQRTGNYPKPRPAKMPKK